LRAAVALAVLLAAPASPPPDPTTPSPSTSLGAGSAPKPAPSRGAAGLDPVALRDLEVTEGELRASGGALRVDGERLRATAPAALAPHAAVRFRYLGPSAVERPLGSGRERRQIGLKLLAEDGCNVLYVMWRLVPRGEVVVQLKRNPGRRRSAECGNEGYRTLRADAGVPVGVPREGEPHLLEAEVQDGVLRVRADGVLCWSGELPPEALALRGPAGVRSDNGRFAVELLVPRTRGERLAPPVGRGITRPRRRPARRAAPARRAPPRAPRSCSRSSCTGRRPRGRTPSGGAGR
jgi:hypothetical protein